jgi:hypothetical protein
MSRDTQLKSDGKSSLHTFWSVFARRGSRLDAIYLIGVQELGQIHREFKRWKIKSNAHRYLSYLSLMVLWIRLYDDERWPHYRVKEELPPLKRVNNLFNEGS